MDSALLPLHSATGSLLGWLTPAAARVIAADLRAMHAARRSEADAAMRLGDSATYRRLDAEARELTAILCHLRTAIAEHDNATARLEDERHRARVKLRRLVEAGVVWSVGPCGERVPPVAVP